MNSVRYHLFSRSRRCVCCGLQGTTMVLEFNGNLHRPHFNLYGQLNGEWILFTKDHMQNCVNWMRLRSIERKSIMLNVKRNKGVKVLKLEIHSCHDCPYAEQEGPGPEVYCVLAKFDGDEPVFGYRPICQGYEDWELPIPEWCPLPEGDKSIT